MGRSKADEHWDRENRALGLAVRRVWQATEVAKVDEPELTEVRFKLDADNRTSVLVILKGVQGDRRRISFVGGFDLPAALLAVSKKMAAGALKWREDLPYRPVAGTVRD